MKKITEKSQENQLDAATHHTRNEIALEPLRSVCHDVNELKKVLSYSDIDSNILHLLLFHICLKGHIDSLKHIFTHYDAIDIHAHHDAMLHHAVYGEHNEIIKYLLSAPELLQPNNVGYVVGHADIHHAEEYAFKCACSTGDFDMVQFLLTSPLLEEAANLHSRNDAAFLAACAGNYTNIIQYLLASPEVVAAGHSLVEVDAGGGAVFKHGARHGNLELIKFLMNTMDVSPEYIQESLEQAAKNGHLHIVSHLVKSVPEKVDINRVLVFASHGNALNIVKYLLSSSDLMDNPHIDCANLHYDNNKAFTAACKSGSMAVLEFMIFDCNIAKPSDMDRYMPHNSSVHTDILKMFQVRELHDILQNNLPVSSVKKNHKI